MLDVLTSPVSRDLVDEAQRIVADLEAAVAAPADRPGSGQ